MPDTETATMTLSGSPLNLDRIAARTAQHIVDTRRRSAKDVEQVATAALGVFEANGIYSGLLYLWSVKQKRDDAKAIRDGLLQLLVAPEPGFVKHPPAIAKLNKWLSVSEFLTSDNSPLHDLDMLLLIKRLFEQTLIYVRYGARATAIDADTRDTPSSGGIGASGANVQVAPDPAPASTGDQTG